MLLELAIGDAYGRRFEGADAADIAPYNSVESYASRRLPDPGIATGIYTDDTQMTLAIAEAIVEDDPWTPQTLAQRFVDCYHRDPRSGYARRFRAFLEEIRDGQDFIARIVPTSERSGAAMRAAPIGVLGDIPTVMECSTLQGSITHDTPGGRSSAVAAALMSHYFLYHLGPRKALGAFLDAHVPGYGWEEPWRGHVSLAGVDCVHAAVTAVVQGNSLRDVLRRSIAFGGDVDTVATIAMAAAACCADLPRDLPQRLYESLEDGAYGRTYLERLGGKLMERVPGGGRS
jgi:ADP-ribosylglycohydrolase